MEQIELTNVTKKFGEDIIAVDDISLEVEDGELMVFVGPSGSGKSTFLRIIAGLEKPTEGDILINGEWVNETDPQHRNIAMVFQSFALYPHRTVRQNISFPLEAQGVQKEERNKMVEEAGKTLGITELLERKPSQLSGGQQQRVAVGRALVRDPEVFLMDEPLANLDAKLRKVMRTELVRLQQQLETTMIHVTHNQEEAMTMGDRVAVLNHGQIQQLAPPKELYQQPANRFVGEFIGSPSINTLEGTVSEGTFIADRGDINIALPEELINRGSSDQMTIGIRPENIELVNEPDKFSFTSEIEVVELLGDHQIVFIDLEGTEFQVVVGSDVQIASNSTVHARFVPEKIHLFDGIEPTSDRIKRSAGH